jgi:5'-3' exonuclease
MEQQKKKKQVDYVVVDISNIYYRSFYSSRDAAEWEISGMAIFSVMQSLNKYYTEYDPTYPLVVVFDEGRSWRKDYTDSPECISPKKYKGHRRQNMSEAQQEKFAAFVQHLAELKTLLHDHTTLTVLSGNGLEADDIIAGFCQTHLDDAVVVLSADSDLAQLMIQSNVTVISPITNKAHDLSKYNDDPSYYLFHKCIRGDTADNVQSAYPGVRSTRILAAWQNSYDKVNLLSESWTGHTGLVYKVEDLFNENVKLIDLSQQPDHIKDAMEVAINNSYEAQQQVKFDLMKVLKFLKSKQLLKMIERIELFTPMLSAKIRR